MKKHEIVEATRPLADYVRNLSGEPVMLTMGGKPVAALVPIENADLETVTLSSHPGFMSLIERSRVKQLGEGGISGAEMCHRLGV